jgi:opacity protein-like surface antigen
MKRICYAICLILIVSSASIAQWTNVESPGVEIFGGYSHFIGDQQGFNVSATARITKWLGITADFSQVSSKITDQDFTEKITAHTYLFGPQFSLRQNKRVTPFVRVMLGAATVKSKATSGSQTLEFSDTNFSYGAGGGLDIRVSKNVAIRAIQGGRLSFGVVFRFGNR